MSSEYEFEFDLHDIPAQDRRINKFLENVPEFPDPEIQSFTDKKWYEVSQANSAREPMIHIFMKNGDFISFQGEQLIKYSWNLLEDQTQVLIVASDQVGEFPEIQGLYSIGFHFDHTLILEKENISKNCGSSKYLLLSALGEDQGDFTGYMDKLESTHLSTRMSSFSYLLIILFVLIMMVLYFTLL